MEKIIKYRSEDGIEFETEEECFAHEQDRDSMMNAARLLKEKCEYFSCMEDECKGCPFVVDVDRCSLQHDFPFEWRV